MTTSEIGSGREASDVLLLGAAGNSGRLIAAELAARGLSVRLAGRRREPLEDLARTLAADSATAGGATAGGATTDSATAGGATTGDVTIGVRTVDVSDAASLAGAMAGVGVVLSTIGPFARQAAPVIDACLAAGVPYVDIANEWPAVRGLLDRDEQARAHAVTLVTGAGFGPAATETLVPGGKAGRGAGPRARRSRRRGGPAKRRRAPDDPRVPVPGRHSRLP